MARHALHSRAQLSSSRRLQGGIHFPSGIRGGDTAVQQHRRLPPQGSHRPRYAGPHLHVSGILGFAAKPRPRSTGL